MEATDQGKHCTFGLTPVDVTVTLHLVGRVFVDRTPVRVAHAFPAPTRRIHGRQ